jgi:hypothetical protein
MERLDNLKRVVESMAGRDGTGLTDDYEFSLHNQVGSGQQRGPPSLLAAQQQRR